MIHPTKKPRAVRTPPPSKAEAGRAERKLKGSFWIPVNRRPHPKGRMDCFWFDSHTHHSGTAYWNEEVKLWLDRGQVVHPTHWQVAVLPRTRRAKR